MLRTEIIMAVSHILANKSKDIVTVHAATQVKDVASLLAQHRIGAVVVTDLKGGMKGIVSERDIVGMIARNGGGGLDWPVERIMTHDVKTCSPGDSEEDLVVQMTENRIRHLPVLDGTRLIGIISIGDVVKYRMDTMARETEGLRDYIASAG
jgi:CBS domain-containing protein